MGPRNSFWSVLGPAEALQVDTSWVKATAAASPDGESVDQAKVVELVTILGEAIRVAARCQELFARVRENPKLTSIESLTLAAITHAPFPPTVPQVGRSLGHPRQVIQRAVRVLETKGLVQSQPNPDHKRAALLVSTQAGREHGQHIDGEAAKIILAMASGLSLDLPQLAAVAHGLLTLRDHIDEQSGEGA